MEAPLGGIWPFYSAACRRDVDSLLKKGGSLSAYIARKEVGIEPRKDSWAWRLEREIEKRFKVRYAVAVNSGTAALHCALAALDLQGGEVITSPCTFSATAAAILLAGGTPRFADVDPYHSRITASTVKRLVGKRTRAILPVSLFGGATPHQEFSQYGLPVIDDSCQSVGACIGGAYSGTRATAAAYSFQGGKQVPAGEAGALVTNHSWVAKKARLLGFHGENFGGPIGYNYRPNEVTCCIAYHGLLELEERNKKRERLAAELNRSIGSFLERDEPFFHFLTTWKRWVNRPASHMDGSHVFYTFPFTVHNIKRSLFIKRMKQRRIAVQAGYTPPLHMLKAFRKYQTVPLPVAEELYYETQCLLNCVRPPATEADMRFVANAIRESLS